jgi:DNA-directed RNA polymerase specialized sigma24 family protein
MNGLPVATLAPVALAANSADRLSELFDAHHERLYRLARRLVADADEALDLVQETFLRAGRSPTAVPSGRPDEEAWLRSGCHFHCGAEVNLVRPASRRHRAMARARHRQPVFAQATDVNLNGTLESTQGTVDHLARRDLETGKCSASAPADLGP